MEDDAITNEDFRTFIKNRLTLKRVETLPYSPYRDSTDLALTVEYNLLWKADGTDPQLIDLLRNGGDIIVKDQLKVSDIAYVEKLIDHIYLAYFRFYPNSWDRWERANAAIRDNGFSGIISDIKKSPDFIKMGFRKIK
ncbi:hypothetical protein ACFOHK_16325 [Falsigemmobacter intermedius]|uniref:Uncharacterized protein n=1 Tax=Falsigemmobacter intermedius TaxID=1553448 RepID=A0A3S3WC74_9RHOB|nr:hypothetical protein [Falsigemmobacter intermedius]RWY35602.1 hypothetical protein EP867_18715 [Falsigemmobacter intermedius]